MRHDGAVPYNLRVFGRAVRMAISVVVALTACAPSQNDRDGVPGSSAGSSASVTATGFASPAVTATPTVLDVGFRSSVLGYSIKLTHGLHRHVLASKLGWLRAV